ncbi:MAG TPA: hypothetical protein VEJ18_10645 [Planctomycetota bacterium]|nr:hypothetical protein [Planctomycetota bacterium]
MAWLLVLALASGGDGPLPQDPDRPAVKVDVAALKSHNVFSPHRTAPRASTGASAPAAPAASAPSRPKPPVVTGFFLDADTRAPKVVVEDRNEARLKLLQEPKFLAAGDEVLGCRIESVADGVAVVVLGEVRKEVRVGDAFPDGNWAPPAGAAPAPAEASSGTRLDEGAANDILERLRQKNKKRRDDEP